MSHTALLQIPGKRPTRLLGMKGQELVVGIDFGTCYTSAGVLIGDKVEMVLDAGDALIPTVVHIPQRGDPVVGIRAVKSLATEPGNTVASVKRVLGFPASDPAVRRFAASAAYRVETGPGGRTLLKVGGHPMAPEQVASYVLSRVRDLAEARFGGRVRKAIITQSAAAPPGYHASILNAAKLAHLEVLEIVAEPIAGALALGLHGETTSRRVLVCDFGGGTFDVTAVIQEGLRFQPVACDADGFLGGDDLDSAMSDGIGGLVYKQSQFDMKRDAVRHQQLTVRCEAVKRALSTANEARLRMPEAYIEAGRYRDLDVVVERAWAEPRWEPLIGRARAVIERTMAAASWQAEDVNEVALIGGTSLVPLFRRTVAGMFPAGRVKLSPVAGVAVAMGAALLTGRHTRASRRVPVLVTAEEAKAS